MGGPAARCLQAKGQAMRSFEGRSWGMDRVQRALIVLLTAFACSRPPEITAPETALGAVGPDFTWLKYSNEDYGFELDHPVEVHLQAQSDGPFQILVYTEPDSPFYLRATRDYLPADVDYLLDTPATGSQTIGRYTWKTYSLPNGYGDAIGFSPPIYALQLENNAILYSVLFYHQDSLTDLQSQILSTFHVLD
jgi:hypothetical protein